MLFNKNKKKKIYECSHYTIRGKWIFRSVKSRVKKTDKGYVCSKCKHVFTSDENRRLSSLVYALKYGDPAIFRLTNDNYMRGIQPIRYHYDADGDIIEDCRISLSDRYKNIE